MHRAALYAILAAILYALAPFAEDRRRAGRVLYAILAAILYALGWMSATA